MTPAGGKNDPRIQCIDDDWMRVVDLLNDKVVRVGDCWEWTGYRLKSGSGHGLTRRWPNHQEKVLVHRWVWEEFFGEIPDCVLHHCDNPPCVRPSHLWLGSQQDNIADMHAKGRVGNTRGRWDGIHCGRGHVLEGNSDVSENGWRRCKICRREREERYRIEGRFRRSYRRGTS